MQGRLRYGSGGAVGLMLGLGGLLTPFRRR